MSETKNRLHTAITASIVTHVLIRETAAQKNLIENKKHLSDEVKQEKIEKTILFPLEFLCEIEDIEKEHMSTTKI